MDRAFHERGAIIHALSPYFSDILLDLKLLDNINSYWALHDEEVSIDIDLLRKYDAKTLKEFSECYGTSVLKAVPDEFLVEKSITENYLKLDKIRRNKSISSTLDESISHYSRRILKNANEGKVEKQNYFLVANIRAVRLITMSDYLTNTVFGKYNCYYNCSASKKLIDFNYEVLSIINSASYHKLCESRLNLRTRDEVDISLSQEGITLQHSKKL